MPRDSRITLHFLGRPPRFILRSASLAKWEANQGGLQCTKIKSPQIALCLIFIGLAQSPPIIIAGLLDQGTGSGLPPQRFPVGSLTQRQIPFPQQRPLSKSLYLNSSLRISAPQDKRRQSPQRPHTWPRRRTKQNSNFAQHRTAGGLGSLDQRLRNLPARRGIELEPDWRPARIGDDFHGSVRSRR